jgi:integrase
MFAAMAIAAFLVTPRRARAAPAPAHQPAHRAREAVTIDGATCGGISETTPCQGMFLAEAQEQGLVVINVVRELHGRQRRRGSGQDRHKRKLKVGIDIPTPAEIRALLAHAEGKTRVFLLVAVFSGLRASELRGLRWDDVDLKKGELHVRQRADKYNQIGPPKSRAGERTIPLPPTVVAELREWKLVCPKRHGKLVLVFPTATGAVSNRGNIIIRQLIPTMIAAGIVTPDGNDPERPLAKYTGLHGLRHFFASWCINRKEDGGLGLPGKVVQERLDHASITMTLDTYGHLFPRGDDSAELAAAERLLLG